MIKSGWLDGDLPAFRAREHYRVKFRHARSSPAGLYSGTAERIYCFVETARGAGCVHFIFRSVAGAWLESFTDVDILLGDVSIVPARKNAAKKGRGK